MQDVVYKPQTLDEVSINDAPKEIDNPDYPDVGVAYGGYSKFPRGNKEYELRTQSPADVNFQLSYAGGETSSGLSRGNKDSKDFYCQDIIITSVKAAAITGTDLFYITDGGSIKLILSEVRLEGAQPAVLHFTTPIKFTKGNSIGLNFSARGAGAVLCINFYGWEE